MYCAYEIRKLRWMDVRHIALLNTKNVCNSFGNIQIRFIWLYNLRQECSLYHTNTTHAYCMRYTVGLNAPLSFRINNGTFYCDTR